MTVIYLVLVAINLHLHNYIFMSLTHGCKLSMAALLLGCFEVAAAGLRCMQAGIWWGEKGNQCAYPLE